jgi:plasmid stability protein
MARTEPGFDHMANVTIRNLPDSVHRALKIRAAQHGRSTEAEIREILALAAMPADRVRIGDELRALGQAFGGVELQSTRSNKAMRVADLS